MNKSTFFEPTSRLQLLDKLKHMVRFSDFLLLVSGEKGSGKTKLLEKLLPSEADTTLTCCTVSPEGTIDEVLLVEQLLNQLPAHDQVGDDFAEKLKALYLQLKAFKSVGQKCLIIVDDAERLSSNALKLLLNLHSTEETAESAQILLVGDSKYIGRLEQSSIVKQLEGRVHRFDIERMSDNEIEEYLLLCHPEAASLSQDKKQKLIKLSEGLPGRVETLLAGGKLSSTAKKTSAFPLPALHMGGIGLILVGILAVSLWQFFPEEGPSQTILESDRLSVPLEVKPVMAENSAAEEVKIVEAQSSEPKVVKESKQFKPNDLVAVQSELDRKLKEQENKLADSKVVAVPMGKQTSDAKIANELRAVVQNEVKPQPVTVSVETVNETAPGQPSVEAQKAEIKSTPEPEVKKAPQQVAVVEKKPVAPVKSVYSRSEQQILEWKKSGYTLQMLGARSEKSALGFIQSQKNKSNFHHFSTIYKGAPWHVVIYGEYANRDIANAAIRKLPTELRKIKPWARSVQGVQIDIKKK